jgi:alpha-galactosidase
VDVYRQDFNIDPLAYWRSVDADDRQGLTEIAHVDGYLRFWRELLRRHPRLWIDSCASGGRRNDLETMRLSVPLLRSDYFNEPESQQCHTYGLSLWLPYHGSGLGASDKYWFRSCIFPASRVGWDSRKTDLDYAFLKRMVAEFRRVQPYLLRDYYPLTPYSLEKTAWVAWQFDDPEQGGGAVQAFRRAECSDDTLTVRLRGLDPDAKYLFEDLDEGTTQTMAGYDLRSKGLRITVRDQPGAAVLVYRRE